ncbi:MAG: class I SAM-dependent methyltransferase, partial [Candidatus Cloacimonadota bacterium]|nr:class I SAM-dependent methyltransferase [Candidatus Cloacimonadota bacterium]
NKLTQFEKQRNTIRRLWNIDQHTAHFLYMQTRIIQPASILEIGTSNGFSTFWLASAAIKFHGKIETIEVDKNRFELAQKNLKGIPNIKMHFGLAENIIPKLQNSYQLVFIDAGKIGYITYIKLLLDKISHDAVIIADNVISHQSTVQEYLDFMKKSVLFETITLPIGDGLEISRRKENKNE